jgi:hypothetical protein
MRDARLFWVPAMPPHSELYVLDIATGIARQEEYFAASGAFRNGAYSAKGPTQRLRPESRTVETQAAEVPERQKNDQHQTQRAAEARPTIPAVPVIATTYT